MTAASDPDRIFRTASRTYGIPKIFGILNLTADSFSDGSAVHLETENAVNRALAMLKDGADAIDIGAESTRPGAKSQSADFETDHIVPVVKKLKSVVPDCTISVDTRKAEVAAQVLDAGADWINDVSGFQFDHKMPEAVASRGAGIILMHMRGTPETMQNPENLIYGDIVEDISVFFHDRINMAIRAGIPRSRIMIDPGIGFSKTPAQNVELIRRCDEFKKLNAPLFYGISRKSFLKNICGRDKATDRDPATAGALAWLAFQKIDFVRVHSIVNARDAMLSFHVCSGEE